MAAIDIPERQGVPPETTDTNPHRQLSQNPSRALYDALAEQMFSVPDAVEQPSQISIPGARALVLTEEVESGPQTAFMIDREFCHLHPPEDGSLHMCLPPDTAELARARGWAELHPVARSGMIPETTVMVYGPRDTDELDVVLSLVRASYRYAGGRV